MADVQVDLIDFQSMPDGDYKWLMHYQDHFCKISILHPLMVRPLLPAVLRCSPQPIPVLRTHLRTCLIPDCIWS